MKTSESKTPRAILKRICAPLAAVASLLLLSACQDGGTGGGGGGEGGGGGTGSVTDSSRMAVAQLSPTQGNRASGTVTFIEDGEAVRVVVDLANLSEGKHGFHVHENGDCSAPDATSAGDHFNPEGVRHGGPDAEVRHVGDLGNIVVDSAGRAREEWVDEHLSLEGEHSIIGKAVIVHAGADDLTSQPSGDAGGRVACGVIESA